MRPSESFAVAHALISALRSSRGHGSLELAASNGLGRHVSHVGLLAAALLHASSHGAMQSTSRGTLWGAPTLQSTCTRPCSGHDCGGPWHGLLMVDTDRRRRVGGGSKKRVGHAIPPQEESLATVLAILASPVCSSTVEAVLRVTHHEELAATTTLGGRVHCTPNMVVICAVVNKATTTQYQTRVPE